MTPVSAHDVARELRSRLPDAGLLKIHKLLYYCQGWHLALDGVPMFAENIEAWPKGPVVAKLWRDENHHRQLPNSLPLSPEMLTTIDFVVGRYARLSGQRLIKVTHSEAPWATATERDTSEVVDEEITRDQLREFFGEQAKRLRGVLDEAKESGPLDESELVSRDAFHAEFVSN